MAEMALTAVTLLSLFLALAMGVVAWRLVQEERRRSAARLAALAAELGRDAEGAADEGLAPFAPESALIGGAPDHLADGGVPTDSTGGAPDRDLPADNARHAPASGGAPDSGPPDAPAAEAGGLFASPAPSTPAGWGHLAAVAGAASVVLAVVAGVFLLSGSGAGGNAESADDARPPLDLIALGHAAEGPFLDISGTVRNPPDGEGAGRLSVVATAFDAAGTLVATRRTPVETPALAPGSDTSFSIRLLAAGISRYRISFLLDEQTIPHIDRRRSEPPAVPMGDAS